MQYPFADLELSRRLERSIALVTISYIEAHAALDPQSGASHFERAGAWAFFDGTQSPLTQSFALGLFAEPTAEDLDALDAFFTDRGAAPAHEVSPLAGVSTFDLLVERGCRPIELTSILYQPIPRAAEAQPREFEQDGVRVRLATVDEADLWSATAARGWGDAEELKTFMRDVGRVSAEAEGFSIFFAILDHQPIATAALSMHEGVAHLAGASTIPSARNRGAQRALLEARLQYAASHGCDLATMGAHPGSASQRNAERQGFRIAYTRVKWGPR